MAGSAKTLVYETTRFPYFAFLTTVKLPFRTYLSNHPLTKMTSLPVTTAPAEVEIGSYIYTCSGDGLILFDEYKFDPHARRYLPRKFAVQRKQFERPGYWKAQCIFRGLEDWGTVAEFQYRVKHHNGGMDPQLARWEARLNRRFRNMNVRPHNAINNTPNVNARVRENSHNFRDGSQTAESRGVESEAKESGGNDWRLHIVQHRSGTNPGLILQAEFPTGPVDHAIVLSIPNAADRAHMHQAAGALGLGHETVSGLDGGSMMIIGTGHAFNEVRGGMTRECASRCQLYQEVIQQRRRDVHDRLMRNMGDIPIPEDVWDIRGTWKIRCVALELESGLQSGSMEMQIFIKPVPYGRHQIWATFDFGVITGVMRFVNPALEDSFILTSYPSQAMRRWGYRWRGEETGENEIQLDADSCLQYIGFSGPADLRLRGLFQCFGGVFEFYGNKVGPTKTLDGDVDLQWNRRSEAAYERASRERWRRP